MNGNISMLPKLQLTLLQNKYYGLLLQICLRPRKQICNNKPKSSVGGDVSPHKNLKVTKSSNHIMNHSFIFLKDGHNIFPDDQNQFTEQTLAGRDKHHSSSCNEKFPCRHEQHPFQ